jgi:hypothetical protein
MISHTQIQLGGILKEKEGQGGEKRVNKLTRIIVVVFIPGVAGYSKRRYATGARRCDLVYKKKQNKTKQTREKNSIIVCFYERSYPVGNITYILQTF